jgi:ABC-type Zn uptake system ZnuABC Zn-binding protein ZnuA
MVRLSVAVLLTVPLAAGAEPLKLVATLPAYASIAQAVGGDAVEALSIARGDEDAHFVKPKPSFALELRSADLFVTTGLDLELWAPVLVDKSGNRAIRDGQPGFVSASQGVPLQDIPTSADRAAGDVHIYGNPHIFTSPLNAKLIGRNIAAGLARVDPQRAADYEAGLAAFARRIDEAMFGEELVHLVGGDALDGMARKGTLLTFLRERSFEGRPLVDRLGGWMGRALPLRGARIVTYHKNWGYFTDLFGIEVVDYVEPKPGIPPSARHVFELIGKIRSDNITALLAASYFSPQQIAAIADRTGCTAVRVPLGPGVDGIEDYFALIDRWIDRLLAAAATRR